MLETEKAWFAGVLDSDGSIGLYDYGREGRRVQVQVANTCLELCERAKEVVGCGSVVRRGDRNVGHLGTKPMFQYTLKGSERGLRVLEQILPYLIVKREKAQGIIAHLRSRPFGRWAAGTPEARVKAGILMRESWKDPEVRARRIAGMRRYFAERENAAEVTAA